MHMRILLYLICLTYSIPIYATIDLDSIFAQVAQIESTRCRLITPDEINYGKEIKIKASINDHLLFSSINDTIFIMDNWSDTGYFSFIIWNSKNALFYNDSNLSDASAFFIPNYHNRGLLKQFKLLKSWNTAEITRIGIKNPPNVKYTTSPTRTIVARIIIRKGKYSIQVIEYWKSGFNPLGWDEF